MTRRPGHATAAGISTERRSNETHASTTDPEARMYRKSFADPARLAYLGHVLMENRNGLVVDAALTQATGRAEREPALEMVQRVPGQHRITLGADEAYDTCDFVTELQGLTVTPHVACNLARRGGSTIDGRTTRHASYGISQVIRKRIEEVFAWAKQVGPVRKTKFRGLDRVAFQFVLTMAAYNLVRMRNLLAMPPPLDA